MQKLLKCFSKTLQCFCVSYVGNFNVSLTNDVVSFENLSPDCNANALDARNRFGSLFFLITITILYHLFFRPTLHHPFTDQHGTLLFGIEAVLLKVFHVSLISSISLSRNVISFVIGPSRCLTCHNDITIYVTWPEQIAL